MRNLKFRSRKKKNRIIAYTVLFTVLVSLAIVGGVLLYDSVRIEPIRVGEDNSSFDIALGESRTEDFKMNSVVQTQANASAVVYYPDMPHESVLNALKEFCATNIDAFFNAVDEGAEEESALHMVCDIYPLDNRYLNILYTKTSMMEEGDVVRETITLFADVERGAILPMEEYITDIEQLAAYCKDQLGAYETLEEVISSPRFDEGTSDPNKIVLKDRAITILYDVHELTLDTDNSYYISVPIEKLELWVEQEVWNALLATEVRSSEEETEEIKTVQIEEDRTEPTLPENYSPDAKYLSFLFAGGPTEDYTPRILQYFVEMEGRATFFNVGIAAEQQSEVVAQIIASGSEVGNHTYDLKSFYLSGTQEAADQLTHTDEILEGITGVLPSVALAPFLHESATIEQAVTLTFIEPTIDATLTTDASLIVKDAIAGAEHGNFILLNDTTAWSAEATELILRKLRTEGFEFITASEMLAVLAQEAGE